MKYLVSLLCLLAISACTAKKDIVNSFSDNTLVLISDLQDRRQSDSLLLFLESEDAKHRQAAVLAFASVQDSTAIEALGKILLRDSEPTVRGTAAFSIGQTPGQTSASVLEAALLAEKKNEVLREILEALGKVLTQEKVGILCNYTAIDSVSAEGKVWGLYRLALRNVLNDVVVQSAYENLASPYTQVRLGAAHFFARANLTSFSDEKAYLQQAAQDEDVFVRMAATSGLRNLKTTDGLLALEKKLSDRDPRVRISAVRALRNHSYETVQGMLLTSLADSSDQVAVAAAEAFINFAPSTAYESILGSAENHPQWRVQATLYGLAASLNPQQFPFDKIKEVYEKTNNIYQKAALLNVLGRSAQQVAFIGNELIESQEPLIVSAAASAMVACNNAKDFTENQKAIFLNWYQLALKEGDAAVIGIVAQVLGDSTKQFKPLIKNLDFLREAKMKLSLPKDNESLQPVEAALAYLEGRPAIEIKNEFNHAINWSLVKNIKTQQQAIIKTSKGDIVIALLVDEAPGSVANFVQLANQQYYHQKYFHRVVPNFVIQAGCNRGDGYGSEDYSIRSEFSARRYTEGSIGMASAGKDTEGTQWFITHSPTPHLDGRYTIFAEVLSGMDVVNAIGVGDKIISVEILSLDSK